MSTTAPATATQLDLLRGARSIARFLNITPRTVYSLADQHEKTGSGLPIRRIDGMGVAASRTVLRQHLSDLLGPIDEIPVEVPAQTDP